MVIKRYLDTDRFERAKKDLSPLVGLINRSSGEYSLQLRENYFNIYYQGNSLAKVTLNKSGTYCVIIHEKFLQKIIPNKDGTYAVKLNKEFLQELEQYSKIIRKSSHYVCFKIEVGKLYQFFQSKNIKRLSARIREVGAGEEITFEQVLITDNPSSKKFIIIDRQVAHYRSKAQIDLLALRRDAEDKAFNFLIIEIKLGKNVKK